MKFGMKLPNSGPFATAENLRILAVECDKLGYDSLWVTDHINWSAAHAKYHFSSGAVEAWKYPIEPNYYEPLVTLSYLAGVTKQITVGTSIVVLPTRNPVILAKQAACLDQLAGGRFILGVGLGGGTYAKAELGAVGVAHLLGKRGRVADEWIDVIRCIWREPKCSFDGEFIKVTEAEVFPKPLQRPGPPIWIGGWGEAAMRRAINRGDGMFQSHLLPGGIRDRRQHLNRLAVEAGRDPREIQIASEHWLSIAKDAASAELRAAETMKAMENHTYSDQQLKSEEQGVRGGYHLFGTPDMIVQKLIHYRDAGVNHIILRIIGRDLSEMVDSLHLFKERVADQLGN